MSKEEYVKYKEVANLYIGCTAKVKDGGIVRVDGISSSGLHRTIAGFLMV